MVLRTMSVPEQLEGLTLDWFNQAFDSHAAAELVEATVVEIVAGTCTKIRFEMKGWLAPDMPVPSTLIAKGGFAAHSDDFLGMHETEARFYADIAHESGLDTPTCYLSALDPVSGRSIVLLEDLDARPVRWLTALQPLAWHEEVEFIDALARLAAKYWESDALRPDGRLGWVINSYEREAADYIDHYLQPDIWARFLSMPRCACLPRQLHDRDRMAGALDQLAKRLKSQPMTLSHGDTHPGNLFLNGDGSSGFFDAQPRRAPWVKDFAYQLISALDVEDRRRWERPLLSRYLRRLEEHGVAGVPDFEEAWHEYRCEIVYGLFIFMINEGHFQREEINTACTARFAASAMDHRSFELLV